MLALGILRILKFDIRSSTRLTQVGHGSRSSRIGIFPVEGKSLPIFGRKVYAMEARTYENPHPVLCKSASGITEAKLFCGPKRI
jgi:hypothetical protein